MLKHGCKFNLTQQELDVIATYMNDDVRESLHFKLAPCEPGLFLKEYTKRNPDFKELLLSEFDIKMED